jgi:hypothetical protein
MIEPMPDELLIARPQAAMHICGSYVWAAAGTMRATTMTSATETGISPICCQKVDLAARAVRGTHYCTGTSAASQNGSSRAQPPRSGSILRPTVDTYGSCIGVRFWKRTNLLPPRRRPGQLYVRSTIRAGIDPSTTLWL